MKSQCLQDTALPSTDGPAADNVNEPSPIDSIRNVAADLTYPVQEVSIDLVRQKLYQLWDREQGERRLR